MIRFIDWLAHLLYEPALLGKRCAAIPPWMKPLLRIHLIPASWLDRACDAYDRHLGVEDT